MYNPTRMKLIEQATKRLTENARSLCPNCSTPGFGFVEAVKGLTCEICGLPTWSTLKHINRCQNCNNQIEKEFPYKKKVENHQYCNFCNP